MEMTLKFQMMLKYAIRSGSTQRHNRYQQAVRSMLTYHDNGPDLDHLRDFIAPEIANQHAAFLGLI